MSTVTDGDLTRLLDEAASSYDVPERGPDEILAALAAEPEQVPVVRRRWVQLSAAAALVTAGIVFAAAQTGGGGSSSMSTAARSDSVDTYGKYAPDAGAGNRQAYTSLQSAPEAQQRTAGSAVKALRGGVAGSSGSAAGGVGGVRMAPAAALPAPAAAPGFPGQAPAAAPVVGAPATDDGESRVVKSGSIALVVKDKRVTPTLSAVQQAATAEGGYIAASTTDEYGETPSGEVTIRVPVTHFEALVAKVRALDAKVRTASTSGRDVTAQYSDLESQLRTLKATRERFYLILAKTRTIGEILTVQQRVDNISGQIDRIEGQRKLLGNQSDLSTLAVSVSEAGDPVVKATDKPRSGLSQAFIDAKDGFVSGVEAIIRHSGGFLLFLICLVVVLLIGRLGWRVARRRMV